MTPDSAEHVLRGMVTDRDGVARRVVLREGVARLRISAAVSEREAVVSTPGDRWFSIDTDQGLSLQHFEEDVRDAKAIGRLSDYVGVAEEYVVGNFETVEGRWGRTQIHVSYRGRDFFLRRSVGGEILSMLQLVRRRRDGRRQ